MGIKRVVDVGFWDDDKVMDMFSPEDKLFFLYLLTNPHTTQLGIYAINVKHMSFELGYTIETINVLLDRFENKYNMIKYSSKTKEIAIRNFLKHSIIKGGKPVEDCLMKEISKVKDTSLFEYVYSGISSYDNLNETAKKILNYLIKNDHENDHEYDIKNDIENDIKNDYENNNENDNENERYADVSSTNRSLPFSDLHENEDDTKEDIPPKDKKTVPVRHKYGEYQNVLLSDEEMEKLKAEFPNDWEKRIENLSEYIASSGKKYKNFLATIRKWSKNERKDVQSNAKTDNADDENLRELERQLRSAGTWL